MHHLEICFFLVYLTLGIFLSYANFGNSILKTLVTHMDQRALKPEFLCVVFAKENSPYA